MNPRYIKARYQLYYHRILEGFSSLFYKYRRANLVGTSNERNIDESEIFFRSLWSGLLLEACGLVLRHEGMNFHESEELLRTFLYLLVKIVMRKLFCAIYLKKERNSVQLRETFAVCRKPWSCTTTIIFSIHRENFNAKILCAFL